MDNHLVISEIYKSIQGESTYVGLPCVLVRLTGCDLRCSYCDTAYAFSGGTRRTLSKVVSEIDRWGTPLVEITGGEPLLQEPVFELMKTLADRGKTVLLETSGAHDISRCDPRVIRIVDLKCPSSGESSNNRWENLAELRPSDEVKFVIGDRTDFDWAIDIIRKHGLSRKCPVLFSAVWDRLPLLKLAEWVRDGSEPVRLQPQLHKVIWGTTPST
ncbi:MAG: radical SAM protein [Pseudomonadota bacterium]